jgi:proliferating cell nuclear antigen
MVCILKLKTTQATSIKTVIEALNTLLTDVNITFYPYHIPPTDMEKDNTEPKIGGVVIKELNKTSSILIHCKLNADQFEYYSYDYPHSKLTIGINLNNFLKCIKCMSNFDTMTWIIDDEDINKLVLVLESEKEKKVCKINLMDLEDANYEIEPVKFPYSIILPTSDFQNYCKNMMAITDRMNVLSTPDNLFLSGKGEIGVIDFELTASNVSSGLTIIKNIENVNEIVQGTFELKYLIIFTRCSSLCSHVNLFLKNNYPLIVQYSIAKLGEIKFVLSQSKPKTL